MALTAGTRRTFEHPISLEGDSLPLKASAAVYEGAALGNSSGYARPLVAGDNFLGFAVEDDTGGSSDGDVVTPVIRKGVICDVPVVGASAASLGAAVYMSDDGTFTLTASGNSQIGKVSRHVTGTTCNVYFEGQPFVSR